MTANTELTLIDAVSSALNSRDPKVLKAATNLLRVKTYQSGTNEIEFLFDKVFPVYTGIKTDKTDFTCPFCETSHNGEMGLKTHISRMHKDRFQEWKNKQ